MANKTSDVFNGGIPYGGDPMKNPHPELINVQVQGKAMTNYKPRELRKPEDNKGCCGGSAEDPLPPAEKICERMTVLKEAVREFLAGDITTKDLTGVVDYLDSPESLDA